MIYPKDVMTRKIMIIGAGPAGLSAALKLAQSGMDVTLFEADASAVGGLSKTIEHHGFRLDIGGHRFYTKEDEVRLFWQEIMGSDMLKRNRLSRIYFNGKYLNYPLKLQEVLCKISLFQSVLIFFSYLKQICLPKKNIGTFEDWVINRFGKRLFNIFFKRYTEKVWGRNCHHISADWASQRINNLSIKSLMLSLLPFYKPKTIKTLIEEFEYPRLGPGMLWDRVRDHFVSLDGVIHFGHRLERACYKNNQWHLRFSGIDEVFCADELITSVPLAPFLVSLNDLVPQEIHQTLKKFEYRAFLTVAVMFELDESFDDNWIYIHDERVKVARIQNYKNWSPEMVPDQRFTCYGLEYFCEEGDHFWQMSDDELLNLAINEIQILKLPFNANILHFKIVRSPKAYPVYDLDYNQRLEKVRSFLKTLPTLHPIGRAGLHRYNNQDHSIKTAFLTAENILSGKKVYDPWLVNQDAQYIEA
jgi:protoporphyrinogen oxidase